MLVRTKLGPGSAPCVWIRSAKTTAITGIALLAHSWTSGPHVFGQDRLLDADLVNQHAPALLKPLPTTAPALFRSGVTNGAAADSANTPLPQDSFWRPASPFDNNPAHANGLTTPLRDYSPSSVGGANNPTGGVSPTPADSLPGFYQLDPAAAAAVGYSNPNPAPPAQETVSDVAQSWVDEVVAEGNALAVQERWSEALSVFQVAHRKAPTNATILQHRQIARVQTDLRQRLADQKYINYALTDTPEYALSSYNEVLSKIHAFHVDQPDWNLLAHHGLNALMLAFENSEFQNKLGGPGFAKSQKATAEQLKSTLQNHQVLTRTALLDLVRDVARLVEQRTGLRQAATIHEFSSSSISALDTYSSYLSPGHFEDLNSQIYGNFVGIGVELKTEADWLSIVKVIPGGPADQARIRAGDKLLAVNDKLVSVIGGDPAADLLKGDAGSQLTVVVQTPDDKQYRLRLQRRQIDIPSVEGAKIVDADTGVAYLKLSNFQKNMVAEFDNTLLNLKQQGMKSLIIDLRDNPGGTLDESVAIADRFIAGGVIVSTKGRNPLENSVRQATTGRPTWTMPLVVLINENSASASEIFAAAIADHHRGAIVGQRSYGKGSVQGIWPLASGRGGIRLTTAKYYSPSGRKVDMEGVAPDFAIQNLAKVAVDGPDASGGTAAPAEETDRVLAAGIKIAGNQSSGTQSAAAPALANRDQ